MKLPLIFVLFDRCLQRLASFSSIGKSLMSEGVADQCERGGGGTSLRCPPRSRIRGLLPVCAPTGDRTLSPASRTDALTHSATWSGAVLGSLWPTGQHGFRV